MMNINFEDDGTSKLVLDAIDYDHWRELEDDINQHFSELELIRPRPVKNVVGVIINIDRTNIKHVRGSITSNAEVRFIDSLITHVNLSFRPGYKAHGKISVCNCDNLKLIITDNCGDLSLDYLPGLVHVISTSEKYIFSEEPRSLIV